MIVTELGTRYTADDVAKFAGISAGRVRKAFRDGDLRGFIPRGMSHPVLFKAADIERWLDGEAADDDEDGAA